MPSRSLALIVLMGYSTVAEKWSPVIPVLATRGTPLNVGGVDDFPGRRQDFCRALAHIDPDLVEGISDSAKLAIGLLAFAGWIAIDFDSGPGISLQVQKMGV